MKNGSLRALSPILVLVLLILSIGAPSQRVAAQSTCDWAQFVADVTVPDGTNFSAGATFAKTWRLKNIGSCTWTTGYSLVFSSGEKMGGPDSVPLPSSVAPGQTVDVTVNLTAPSTPGSYRGFWQLKNAAGALFGIGTTAAKPFWVSINVLRPFVTAYDFTADICSATWHYDGGPIPCPYNEAKKQYGYVLKFDNPTLEDGTSAGRPGLLTVPQDKYGGVIRGVYPDMDIFPGDHFQATIGCEGGAVGCYVTYRLEYMTANRQVYTIWKFNEKYDGRYVNIDVDLSSIAWRKKISLVLMISANGSATGDRALWVQPRLVRQVDTVPITPTPGPSPTPIPYPTTPPDKCTDRAKFVADVTIPDWTTFAPGTAFTKTWRLSNAGTCTWTTDYSLIFYNGNKMNGPDSVLIPASVAPGQTVDLSVNLTAPATSGSYLSFWILKNPKGKTFGVGSQYDTPIFAAIKVAGTPVATATSQSVLVVPTPTSTPIPPSNVYSNSKYGFTFTLPENSSSTVFSDNRARVSLPFTSGTNLTEKYLDVVVVDVLSPCRTTSFTNPAASSSNVAINGIDFLVETGTDSALGNTFDWKAYSTTRNNACISMNFVLHSANNGASPFDKAAESSVFDALMSSFRWMP
ncbi:MAG: hypothetical protein HXY35_04010 [Chloroflexi bacterium]|nr:hypothetical protein [Chloroflexota bacterium]